MHQTAPLLDPDKLYQSLNTDLQRRIELVGAHTSKTFGILTTLEIVVLSLAGILAPLIFAWCML